MSRAPILLRWVPRLGSLRPAQRHPGDAKWGRGDDAQRWLLFCCPSGCGELVSVRLSTKAICETADGLPCWQWDGDELRPTLRPSIQYGGACRWHGYLTAGVFQTI